MMVCKNCGRDNRPENITCFFCEEELVESDYSTSFNVKESFTPDFKLKLNIIAGAVVVLTLIIGTKLMCSVFANIEYAKAKDILLVKDYAQSITHLQKVVFLKPKNFDAKIFLLNSYINCGKFLEAEALALQLQKTYPDNSDVYTGVINLYLAENQSQKAIATINESYEKTKNVYFSLMSKIIVPDAPRVKLEEGDYDKIQKVEIRGGNNSIYYTLDGTPPTTNSTKYETPFDLPEGKSVLTVVAVNDKGVSSVPASYTYNIDIPLVVAEFSDSEFERLVREYLKMLTGTIYEKDLLKIKSLAIVGDKIIPEGLSGVTAYNENSYVNEEGKTIAVPVKGKIQSLDDLRKFGGLTELSICYQESLNIPALKELSKLTKVYLVNDNFTDSASTSLTALTDLLELDIRFNPNENINAYSFSSMNRLEKLMVSNVKFSDLTSLDSLPNLKTLYLLNGNLSNLNGIEDLKKLKELNVAGNNIADYSKAQAIAGLKILK